MRVLLALLAGLKEPAALLEHGRLLLAEARYLTRRRGEEPARASDHAKRARAAIGRAVELFDQVAALPLPDRETRPDEHAERSAFALRAARGLAERVKGLPVVSPLRTRAVERITLVGTRALEDGARRDAGACFVTVVELTREVPEKARRERWLRLVPLMERALGLDAEELDSLLVDGERLVLALEAGKVEARFLDALARLYAESGSRKDLLHALTLLGALSRLDKRALYTRRWWRWRLRIMRIYVDYGERFRDKTALRNVVSMYERFEALGVLENCPVKDDLKEVYERARK